jgi:hypothetical protein
MCCDYRWQKNFFNQVLSIHGVHDVKQMDMHKKTYKTNFASCNVSAKLGFSLWGRNIDWGSENRVVSRLRASQPKPCKRLSPSPCAPHVQPTLSSLI